MMDDTRDESLVHFLLVEDDDRHAKLMMRSLEANRVAIRLTRVRDGREALDYLQGIGEYAGRDLPGVILLDLKLPKVSGLEVLRHVKNDEALRKIPVVVLTTSTNEEDRRQAYSSHVNSYLRKPVDFGQFQNLVHDLGHYWGVWNIGNPE